ncbi:hypothetical protein NLO413_0970 [Candidatus Neoehrlichia lotoris str. RAC413]|uniref:MgtE intracellular N domain protein n=2 Tax=Candidatus Neoehrlichia procyonis TaxID=467750 RepID=A0A0F3NNF7_9RICK|nr:hypothetical protein NLO413_0970 [Candidatus Neoehrlichia lotoris str. RAC413]
MIKENIISTNRDSKSTTFILSSYINKFYTDPTSTTQIIAFHKNSPHIQQYLPNMLIYNIINKKNASTIYQYFTHWEKNLAYKEQLLYEISKSISSQINYLVKIKQEISKVSIPNDNNINASLSRIINIYESIPAHDVAQIFDALDSKTTLYIASHMQKSKLLPVLAHINNNTIKNITLEAYNTLIDNN